MITQDLAEGEAALKVSWSIFGNTEMYHLCVQYKSSRTREESALVPVEPIDRRHGRTRDSLPVRELVGELIVRYQSRIT